MNEIEITNAYNELAAAKTEYHFAEEEAIIAREALESARLTGLADRTITGTNEALREASARGILAEQYAAVRVAEARARHARYMLDMAQIDVDAIRARLRLLEATREKGQVQ
jgi:hypothetical protein